MKTSVLVLGPLVLTLTACAEPSEPDVSTDFRIINGEPAPASVAQYAATVGLHFRFGPGFSSSPNCSGVLIREDIVLTAAHCLNASSGAKVRTIAPDDVRVYLGDGPASAGGTFVSAIETAIHADYSPSRLHNDIGLVRLAAPVSFPSVPELPTSLALTQADIGITLDHVGFGYSDLAKTEFGIKLHGETPLGGLGCVYPSCPSNAPADTQISYEQSEDGPCNGDSGGPAFVERAGTIYVAGITSYGDSGCAIYGVSTAVSAFEDWIAQTVEGTAAGGDSGGGETCNDNGVCEADESCDGRNGTLACPSDCPGQTKGRPSLRFCYVGDVCEGSGC
jgi:secreted trypsin-like serine protease